MIILERDGTLSWNAPNDPTCDKIKDTIDLPADLVTEQSNIIDRVLDFAFEVLGLQAIEMRIREE